MRTVDDFFRSLRALPKGASKAAWPALGHLIVANARYDSMRNGLIAALRKLDAVSEDGLTDDELDELTALEECRDREAGEHSIADAIDRWECCGDDCCTMVLKNGYSVTVLRNPSGCWEANLRMHDASRVPGAQSISGLSNFYRHDEEYESFDRDVAVAKAIELVERAVGFGFVPEEVEP